MRMDASRPRSAGANVALHFDANGRIASGKAAPECHDAAPPNSPVRMRVDASFAVEKLCVDPR